MITEKQRGSTAIFMDLEEVMTNNWRGLWMYEAGNFYLFFHLF